MRISVRLFWYRLTAVSYCMRVSLARAICSSSTTELPLAVVSLSGVRSVRKRPAASAWPAIWRASVRCSPALGRARPSSACSNEARDRSEGVKPGVSALATFWASVR